MDNWIENWVNKIEIEMNKSIKFNAFDRACERIAKSSQGQNLTQDEIEEAAISLMQMEWSV